MRIYLLDRGLQIICKRMLSLWISRDVEYMSDIFPYDELLLEYKQVVNIQNRLDMSFTSEMYFLHQASHVRHYEQMKWTK